MSVSGVNLPYRAIQQTSLNRDGPQSLNIMLENGLISSDKKHDHQGAFKSFLNEQTNSFVQETKASERLVTGFTKGESDIESVASNVAGMSIKVEAFKRVLDELKTGIHALVTMPI